MRLVLGFVRPPVPRRAPVASAPDAAALIHPDASVADCRLLQMRIGTQRNVIVQPSAYGAVNRLLLQSLAAFGHGSRGACVVERNVREAELTALHAAGVRGARFDLLFTSQSLTPDTILEVASRIAEHGWHLQLCALPDQLLALESTLDQLCVPVVIDHMGLLPPEVRNKHGVVQLLESLIVERRGWIKLSGAYITSATSAGSFDGAERIARHFIDVAPDRLVWGSDWPHPSRGEAEKPDDSNLIDLLFSWAQSDEIARRILVDNAAQLYGFEDKI